MADTKTQTKKNIIFAAIGAMRPIHWTKNLSIFAAFFLTGALFERSQFILTFWAFISFCLATSGTYIINDIFDIEVDKLHPAKKFRPIASGDLPVLMAVFEALGLFTVAFIIPLIFNLNPLFITILFFYITLQFFYSIGLKNVAIVDIIIIATGFVLRVYAGAFTINAHLSVWFLLCVISVALFLASGKRRAELNVVENLGLTTRKSLGNYQKDLLNSYVTMFGNASWMSWSLFTFFESPKAALPFWLVLAELSRTTTIGKLLMATIPVTIFGIMRYESLIFNGKGETPEKILLTDKLLLLAISLWVGIVYWVLYAGVSTGL